MARALAERTRPWNYGPTLASQAIEAGQGWVQRLGPVPSDPSQRARWRREVSTIAAYRDRWHLTGPAPIGTVAKVGCTEQMSQFRLAFAVSENAQNISQIAGTKQANISHDVSIDVVLGVER